MAGFETGPDFRITKVWAKNFRSIADVSFELDPLTILVGANASGKSNLLDILRFIKDALRFDLEVAVSIRQGMEGVARHGAGDGRLDIEMGIEAIVRKWHFGGGYCLLEYGFTLVCMNDGGYRVGKEYGKVREGDNSAVAEFVIEEGNLASLDFFHEGSRYSLPSYGDTDFDTEDLAFPTFFRMYRPLIARDAEISERGTLSLHRSLHELHQNLTSMRFYRILPNTIREPQRVSNTLILEEDATNLGTIIKELTRVETGSMARLRQALGLLIPGISDVRVDVVGGYLVVKLKRDAIDGDGWLDLSMESDGTVRLLGLLVALYQRRLHPRFLPVIGIEEPELMVHPGALAALADVLNEATRRSHVIVTTHSPDLIDFLTDYRTVENLRVVELEGGVTTVHQVPGKRAEAVKKHLFSPGELYRMGELTVSR